MAIQFIDLKSQCQALKSSIDAGIYKMFDQGHDIMGPEGAELGDKFLAYAGARPCIPMTADLLQQEHDHIVKAVIEALGK